jgi:hypothetical protein
MILGNHGRKSLVFEVNGICSSNIVTLMLIIKIK